MLSKLIVPYDVRRFDFRGIVARHFEVDDLTRLHVGTDYPLLSRERDQSTHFHKRFYDIGDDFFAIYADFLKTFVRPMIGEDVIYQRVPTFRVHLPGNVAVGEYHRDRDYNHQRTEINFWLPLTPAWGTNTVWVEEYEGAGDCHPVAVEYGQVLVFDGANLLHGNRTNTEDSTRVSFDFRVIPASLYEESDAASINTNMRFSVGAYFERL